MAQNQINTGNVVNDGLGAPLRTAFNETNLNFNQIWAAGPVNSNIQITNNTIQATNTNGNIVLATNGTGAVVPAASIVPDIANVRMLGTGAIPFNTVYAQYVNANSGAYSGNLYVAGNLLVDGAQVSINRSDLNISNSTLTLSTHATSPVMADGSGILVDGAGAAFTYSSANSGYWISNLPIAAPHFVGDGSGLTNVAAITSAASMSGNTIASTVLYSNLQSVGTLANLTVGGSMVGNTITSTSINTGALVATTLAGNGSGITNITGAAVTGNVGSAVYATFAGSSEVANLAALATQAINADTALVALNANYANTAKASDFAQLANVANTACMADLANAAVVAGMAETIAVQTSITVTGNIVAGGILTDYYYYANGTPFIGSGGAGNYSNANVAAFLPTYSGDLGNLGNIRLSGTAYLNNVSISGTTVATSVSASGSVASNAVYAGNYYYANGVPFIGSSSGYVLGDQQFIGDGTVGPYTLTQVSTNNTVIVTINGLVQAPGSTYNVAGTNITFTTPVLLGETVDIRFLGSAVTGISVNPYEWTHVPTDIIPLTTNTQNFGNSTNQWNSVWLSNVVNNGNTWTFDPTGNLTLPSNHSFIKYANGQPYGGGGGGGTPGGVNHSIQFNANGVFSGTSMVTTDGANLSVHGTVTANGGVLTNNITIDNQGAGNVKYIAADFNGSSQLVVTAVFAEQLKLYGNQQANSIGFPVSFFNDDFIITGYDFSGRLNDHSLIAPAGNINIVAGLGNTLSTNPSFTQSWQFDTHGNLTLPGNTFAVNYANGTPVSLGGLGTNISVAGNITGNTVHANAFYVGNTIFTRTLTVGRAVTPVTVPLSSNNSFNVLTANGSANITVYTT